MVMKKVKKVIIKLVSVVYGKNVRITEAYLRKFWRKYIKGNYGSSEVDLVIKFLDVIDKNKGVLFDVGACVGSFSEPFIWGEWKIYAFEPDLNPLKVNSLKMLSELNNVFYINKACSNKSGDVLPFYASDVSTGISSLHAFHSSHKKIGEVESITLSEFIQKERIEDVCVLKIDTEGHDLFVLQGFPWGKIKPSVIFCEFEDSKTLDLGYDFKKFGDFLLNKGYRVFVSEWYPVVKYGGNHVWRQIISYPCELENPRATGNFICFSEDIWDEKYSKLITDFQVMS